MISTRNHEEDRAIALCDRNRTRLESTKHHHTTLAREAVQAPLADISDPAEKRSLAWAIIRAARVAAVECAGATDTGSRLQYEARLAFDGPERGR